MLAFDCGRKFRIDMITPEAPADDLARIRVGTSALAVGRCSSSHIRCGIAVERPFEYRGFVLGWVLWAEAEAQ
jgi:hypothetical protein